jgi:hypothetical protein
MIRHIQHIRPPISFSRQLKLKRLHFSTTTTNEIKNSVNNAKKQDSFFDKLKRWSKRLSPVIAFSVVSTFVIGNLSIRHYTESVFPSYVQFLRDNYGFDDEDPIERARVAAIEAANAKSKLLDRVSCSVV